MEALIFILIVCIAILGSIASFSYAKSMMAERLIREKSEYVRVAVQVQSSKREVQAVQRLTAQYYKNEFERFKLKHTPKDAANQKEPDWSIANDDAPSDPQLDVERFVEWDKYDSGSHSAANLLPNSPEPAAILLQNGSQNAPISLQIGSQNAPERLNIQDDENYVSRGGIYIKQPVDGDKFFGQFKIEKHPFMEVIFFYRKKENQFHKIKEISLNELELGKSINLIHNGPSLLLCGYQTCGNVTLKAAHNAKYCGCEDCTKY